MKESPTTNAEVLRFADALPSWGQHDAAITEESMLYGVMPADNNSVFSRPVKIYEFQWPVSTIPLPLITINPWALFLEDTLNSYRLTYFKNLRGNLVVKFLVNGNPFYYGRMIASYLPYGPVDTVADFSVPDSRFLIPASQRQHVYIDPTRSQGGEMKLPFLWHENFVSVFDKEWRTLGNITMGTLNPLQHANDSTLSVTVSVFAYMEDVVLTTPTARSIVPQGDVEEKGKSEYGMVSAPAHTIANWTGKLSNAPVIGKYARATSMVASAVGNVAQLFGYSSQIQFPECRDVVTSIPNLAATNMPTHTHVLSVDSKKEVTVDPRVVGTDGSDQMALVPLACRESYVSSFSWDQANPPEQPLYSIRVSPVQGSTIAGRTFMTPSAWVALPFEYWTGQMEFRFQVVCSQYHRGRLLIRWDPTMVDITDANNYNQTYSTIVDIQNTTDVSFKVGWGQPLNYLKVTDSTEPVFPKHTPGLPITSSFDRTCNGIVSVWVLNYLTSATPSTQNIFVNVFAKMCDDFEVHSPSAKFFRQVTAVTNNLTPVLDPNLSGIKALPQSSPPGTNVVPPVVAYTAPAAGVLTPAGFPTDAVQWSTTIGVSAANKGSVLLTDGPSLLSLYTQNDTTSTRNLTITFSNPSANARVITLKRPSVGPDIVVNLAASIGATATATIPAALQPGVNEVRFEYSATGAGGRILATQAGIFLEQGTEISFIEDTTLTELDAALSGPSLSTVSGVTTSLNSVNPMKFPSNMIPGIPLTMFSPDIFELGRTPNYTVFSSSAGGDNGMRMAAYRPFRNNPTYQYMDFIGSGRKLVRMFYHRKVGTTSSPGSLLKDFTLPAPSIKIVPQGDIEEKLEEEQNKPVHEVVEHILGPSSICNGACQVYFGEEISSWRQMLRRKIRVYTATMAANTAYHLALTPFRSGLAAFTNDSVIYDYIASAYLGYRGSGIYSFFNTTNTYAGFVVTRAASNTFTGVAVTTVNDPGWSGMAISNLGLLRYMSVNVPYYSNHRFDRCRTNSSAGVALNRPGIHVLNDGNGSTARVYWSAGEDFSLVHFISVPSVTFVEGI